MTCSGPEFEVKGTSFVLFFHPFCYAHQQGGQLGNALRQDIIAVVNRRFLGILERFLPKENAETDSSVRIAICERPRSLCNNGELFIWLDGLVLPEDVVFKMISALKESMETQPFSVSLKGVELPVRLYGYGFRYLPSAETLGLD